MTNELEYVGDDCKGCLEGEQITCFVSTKVASTTSYRFQQVGLKGYYCYEAKEEREYLTAINVEFPGMKTVGVY